MPLPTISNYGKYSSDNYGAHTLRVDIAGVTVWFSYQTPVAFRVGNQMVISENIWGRTTGKHLNWISDRSERVSHEEFERLWDELVEPLLSNKHETRITT